MEKPSQDVDLKCRQKANLAAGDAYMWQLLCNARLGIMPEDLRYELMAWVVKEPRQSDGAHQSNSRSGVDKAFGVEKRFLLALPPHNPAQWMEHPII